MPVDFAAAYQEPSMPVLSRPLSLATRITATVGLAMAAVFVAFAIKIGHSVESHFIEQDLGELQAVAKSLEKAIGQKSSGKDSFALERRLAQAVAGHHGVFFSVRGPGGVPLYGTAPTELVQSTQTIKPMLELSTSALHVWSVQGRSYRGAVLQVANNNVLVAVGMDFHLHYLARLRQGLWWGAAAACAASVLAAWLAVRWGHAPLRRISAAIRGISSEQLHVRLEPAEVPLELADLVASFNQMLDRLQASFERLSHFSADIAHELRTPVTNLTTQTQVALSHSRPAEEYKEVLYSSLEELEHMGKMIGDMLFLAQADHHLSKPEKVVVDLVVETQTLFDYFEALAEDVGVRLVLDGQAPAVYGDRLMLRRALSNLLSNALRYAPRGEAITVRLGQVGDVVEVCVENPGPEIAEEHLPKLFDRFFRIDPARQHKGEGSGLGLSIVKAIAEAHGGTVSVRSGAGLTCFCIRLPQEL